METNARKPRLLWANRYCLFDRSSGASLSAREMLKQLSKRGFDIKIVGATIFDSENGRKQIDDMIKGGIAEKKFIRLKDEELEHNLVCTKSHSSEEMAFNELGRLYNLYEETLRDFEPDIVWMYGGQFFDRIILEKAKNAGAKTVFYLVNANYKGHKWHEHVDKVITDTQATANMYKDRLGIDISAVGTFIDRKSFVATKHSRKNITFINPKPAKGSLLVAQVAFFLEDNRPDIQFEVVESRGVWAGNVEIITKQTGYKRSSLNNVLVTPTTTDMRPIYGRSRVILAPSLWWESGSRVLAEGLLNGIPAIVTNDGGSPEMVGPGGIKLGLPKVMHESPYSKLLPKEAVINLAKVVEKVFDDKKFYATLVAGAKKHANEKHDMAKNAEDLVEVMNTIVVRNLDSALQSS